MSGSAWFSGIERYHWIPLKNVFGVQNRTAHYLANFSLLYDRGVHWRVLLLPLLWRVTILHNWLGLLRVSSSLLIKKKDIGWYERKLAWYFCDVIEIVSDKVKMISIPIKICFKMPLKRFKSTLLKIIVRVLYFNVC